MARSSLEPIVLSAKRAAWRMRDAHADEHDRHFQDVRGRILARDDFTCRFCGLRSPKYQEVHHRDDDHSNNSAANLVSACPLCHQCHHLGLAGIRHTGTIIWCPEIEQGALNLLTCTIFVAVANHGEHERSARALYSALESRAAIVDQELGAGASNPSALGQAFLEMSEEQYASRGERLAGLRLLARMQGFSRQIAFWQSDKSLFGALPDATWLQMTSTASERLAELGLGPAMRPAPPAVPRVPASGTHDVVLVDSDEDEDS